jgi:hypothetical protein
MCRPVSGQLGPSDSSFQQGHMEKGEEEEVEVEVEVDDDDDNPDLGRESSLDQQGRPKRQGRGYREPSGVLAC